MSDGKHVLRLVTFCVCLFLGLSFISTEVYAQELPGAGVPLLENYSPVDYLHKGKLWDIDSAPNGMLYMASDKGLLEFDGKEWQFFNGSDGIIRSVEVINDTLIYTGSDLDFGIWVSEDHGSFSYTSLYPFKEDLLELSEEFWGLHVIENRTYFVSNSNIYVYSDENLTKIPLPASVKSSFEIDGNIYFSDSSANLYRLENLRPVLMHESDVSTQMEIRGMYRTEDNGLMLVTRNYGLYKYENNTLSKVESPLSEQLKDAAVFSFQRIGDNHFAFGTVLEGIIIANSAGQIIHNVGKEKGLQNNTVLSLHHSPSGTLWAGLDYGVSSLSLNSNITFVYDYNGNFGTGYTALLHNDTFYLGTNQGLYQSDWNRLKNDTDFKFDLITGTSGQVWELKKLFDKIWMSHDQGLFQIEGGGIQRRVGNQAGFLTIERFKDVLFAGTYDGISIYRKKNGEWEFDQKMNFILGACNRIVAEEDNVIWVNVLNFGVIRVVLDENLQPQARSIFEKNEFNGDSFQLRKEEGQIEVKTNSHRYGYNSETGSFEIINTHRDEGEIRDVLSGNAEPLRLNNHLDFYPVYNGFALKDHRFSRDESIDSLSLVIRKLQAYNNVEQLSFRRGDEISSDMANISVTVIVPNTKDLLYQYKLDSAEKWSNWTESNTFNLVDLSYGDKTLKVRAKADEKISSTEKISFSIARPWYTSWFAYLFYLVAFVILIVLLYKWQQRIMERLSEKLETDKQRLIDKQEAIYREQIERLEKYNLKSEKEQVEQELRNKSFDLANIAKENQDKIQVLESLKEKIEALKSHPESIKTRIHEIQKMIDAHIEEGENRFELQLDELNQKLFARLKDKFPDLTQNDLRLCAYIKSGYNAKEIADIMNIKPSSVYINRSRLRKKLNMESDEDLQGFLNSVVNQF